MFAVAWGERAIELMDLAGGSPERTGPLAVVGAPGATDGSFRCWISGRLTNAQELCERFGLPSDCELSVLIARVYARVGLEACQLLRGTFVVVAFDRERETASVLRDHLGGRPLLHARVGSGALFAEHERAIVDLLPGTPAVDRPALTRWIERGSVPLGRTLFADIRHVPPAHRALLSNEPITIEPYWQPRYEGLASGSREEIADGLREAAFAAVGRAAQGTHRPAVSLSGGLDSSCVAAGLAAQTQSPSGGALALAGVFPKHPETDERELIEATAGHAGLPVELISFDDRTSVLEPALEHIDRWSLPPATPNLFVWKPLMARARDLGVDVMLDGEGGDELFGFAPYLFADLLRTGRALAAWRLTRRIPEVGADPGARMRLRALRVFGIRPLLPSSMKRQRQSATSLLFPADELALSELSDDAKHSRTLDGPVWWRALAESLTQAGGTLGASGHLRRESIDEGIDGRHPFLFDLDLLQRVLAIPPELQFDPVRNRALLRDGLTGHIPEAVRTRPTKSVFTDLLADGLATDGPLLARGPSQRDAPVRGFVRADALEQLLGEAADARGTRATRRLWHIGLADAWLRALDQPDHPRQLIEESRHRH